LGGCFIFMDADASDMDESAPRVAFGAPASSGEESACFPEHEIAGIMNKELQKPAPAQTFEIRFIGRLGPLDARARSERSMKRPVLLPPERLASQSFFTLRMPVPAQRGEISLVSSPR
jgi:hypothetical protein